MATYTKFQQFVEDLANGVHDFSSDTFKIALTNTQPSATDATLSQITELTPGGGYSAGGETVGNTALGETGGTATFTGDDVTFTASGGTIGPFRYAVFYNDTPTSPADPLISYWAYSSSITLQDGETFDVSFTDGPGDIFDLA